MATQDHTSARSRRAGNPLGRRHWTLGLASTVRDEPAARLNGIAIGLHALAVLLGNNDAFREQYQDHPDEQPLDERPLDAFISEGLHAALYFLSEYGERVSGEQQAAFDHV